MVRSQDIPAHKWINGNDIDKKIWTDILDDPKEHTSVGYRLNEIKLRKEIRKITANEDTLIGEWKNPLTRGWYLRVNNFMNVRKAGAKIDSLHYYKHIEV